MENQHEKFIKRCYELAISAGKKGYDTFGAVLVSDNKIIKEAKNTSDYKKGIFGHAEFNLVHKVANKFSDKIFENAIFYTSCAPCVRCLMAIASLGIKTIVFGVSYKSFEKLLPFEQEIPNYEEILKQMNVSFKMVGPILEDEGMHVFEYWGGEYHPLEELIREMDELKKAKMIIRNAQSKDCFSISKICKNDLIQLTNKDEIFKNYEIYKSCMYMPTEEKFCNLIEKYLNEKSIKIFCCKDENKTNGMIVVSFIEDKKIEVFGIAVDTLHQHKGIGSFMINNLIEKFNLKYILAETDNDAVGFYRKNNFAITQFEKIYNNTKVIRYKCELIK